MASLNVEELVHAKQHMAKIGGCQVRRLLRRVLGRVIRGLVVKEFQAGDQFVFPWLAAQERAIGCIDQLLWCIANTPPERRGGVAGGSDYEVAVELGKRLQHGRRIHTAVAIDRHDR